jgi:nicotinate-nucleotide pyrophosphorylase (carboxylating)
LRALEKYAVRAGGGMNHRAGLDDGILIKDNHIRLSGGVAEAIRRMKQAGQEMLIEVEAQSLEDVDAAIAAGADLILLDNLPLSEIREAVQRIGGRMKIEISGGVTLERIPQLATTGADYVSVGALTHSARAVDLSFELEPDA